MKKTRKTEQAFWDLLLSEWAVSAWDIVLRTIWLCIFAAAVIGALRLMAWADTGSRKPYDNTILPSERAKDINYGPK